MINRITNSVQVPKKSFLEAIGFENLPTIQYSKSTYTKSTLKSINALCKVFGKKLPIRFFGHYSNEFDASILKYLPDVQYLLIDCLQDISNPQYIFQLSKLKRLSFGVYNFQNSDFLRQLNMENLESLSLSETKCRNIDLTNLGQAQKIQKLFIQGHTKGLSEIGKMSALKMMSFSSISKKVSLEFVSNIANLNRLRIILGGRENINEISHPELRELEIIRVRGLKNLGSLSRFSNLKRLNIEDQIKILSLDLSTPKLRSLEILNCKFLSQLENLETLGKLEKLRCYRTALNYEYLASRDWPDTLKILALYTGSMEKDKIMKECLNIRGYKEYD